MTQASQLAADGVVVAYSIVDRDSYEYARDVVPLLAKQRMPVALMANKADLTQYRTVRIILTEPRRFVHFPIDLRIPVKILET